VTYMVFVNSYAVAKGAGIESSRFYRCWCRILTYYLGSEIIIIIIIIIITYYLPILNMSGSRRKGFRVQGSGARD
jgi:hypothetical protein